jgi:hypothetical protein
VRRTVVDVEQLNTSNTGSSTVDQTTLPQQPVDTTTRRV